MYMYMYMLYCCMWPNVHVHALHIRHSVDSLIGQQVTPDRRTREFGATCPTPLMVSPPVQRPAPPRTVTMVSEAVQTDRAADRTLKQLKKDLGFPPAGPMYQVENRLPIDQRNVRPGACMLTSLSVR